MNKQLGDAGLAGPQPVAKPTPTNLTPPLGAQPTGATAPQSTHPDAALAQLMLPRPAGAGGKVGLSPADKERKAQLYDQAQDIDNHLSEAIQMHRDVADSFGEQSRALADESRIAALSFQQQQQDNAAHRATLEKDAKDSQTRIEGHLADLEAQGIDPNHYWESRTTGQKIGSAISVFFGALGAGAWGAHGQRGPNYALDEINGAIQRDVEAQRTNLQKSIDLTKTRMSLDAQGFDHQRAMLESERESIQTGYNVASQDVARRMSAFGQNAEIAQKGTALIAGLQAERDKLVADVNDKIYTINKAAEKPKPGAGSMIDRKEVARVAGEWIKEEASNGRSRTEEEGRAYAMNRLYGIVLPGVDYSSTGKPGKGGKFSQKDADQMRAHDNAIANIDKLLALRDKHGGGQILPGNDSDEAEALAARTQEDLVAALGKTNKGLLDRTSHLVPDHPLDTKVKGIFGADPIGTRLRAAKRMLEEERERLKGPPGEPIVNPENPQELERDEEEK